METRRSFLKKSMLASGALGVAGFLPESVQRAFAISPDPGSTFFDAEHVVILMQENRSFDHAFGTLRGVRGFNDPRAIFQPDKNKVWLQTNRAGETYCPFRLDILNTKITWMGSLPHGRRSQMEARNNGMFDNWLEAKKSDDSEEYGKMPLTMGYYTREDIPFYYALADAFTICDQNFCSSLTGTDPNRLYFWSGTVRQEQQAGSRPYVQNDDVEMGVEWETFAERLEKNGISWKVYQNEIGQDHGFTDEQDVWLGNFGDNPLEYFRQFHVKLSKIYIDYLPGKIAALSADIQSLEDRTRNLVAGTKEMDEAQKTLRQKKEALNQAQHDQKTYTPAGFGQLSEHEQNIHRKAFATNLNDPFHQELESVAYTDGEYARQINIPKGDVFHQFRHDVQSGQLPTVSWLVAPEFFSDHPSAPWFGSWYLSEAMDILTQDPAVWKKTIFILAYDENDGYFDHVPPFVAPDTDEPATGKVSTGIDTGVEHVKLSQDSPGPIGLGYRVPLVVASPWTRGGWVNSQVFDHTSTLQFLETFLSKKFAKEIRETNISQWRRTVCGDLSSVFRPEGSSGPDDLPFLKRETFIERIYNAKFKQPPINYKKLSLQEIELINRDAASSPWMPKQEKGTKPSSALPYQFQVDGSLGTDRSFFQIAMQVTNPAPGAPSVGAPFTVYSFGMPMRVRNYAVAAGDRLTDQTPLTEFQEGHYDIQLHGPNGFFRAFKGSGKDPALDTRVQYGSQHENPGQIKVGFVSTGAAQVYSVKVVDNAYRSFSPQIKMIPPHRQGDQQAVLYIDTVSTGGWYDFSILVEGHEAFEKRYAGRIETGKHSITDPVMGGVV